MRKLFCSNTPDDETLGAIVAAGGELLDESGSVGFSTNTVIFSLSSNHSNFKQLLAMFCRNFLMFKTTNEVLVLLHKRSICDIKLLPFLHCGLQKINIGFDYLCHSDEPAKHGEWLIPEGGSAPKTCPFELLDVVDAANIGLVKALYGYEFLGEFECSLRDIIQRKKDKAFKVSPIFWINGVYFVPGSDQLSVRVNILNRSGSKYSVISKIIPNGAVQDAKQLADCIISCSTSVVDRKALGVLAKELLENAYPRIERQLWVQREGWIRGQSGEIEACVCGNELLTVKGVESSRYFLDVKAPRLTKRGTLADWNAKVLAPACESYVLTGAFQLSLASMMLDLIPGVSSSIFNFFGMAGQGKTLLLSTMASMFGNTSAPGQSMAGRTGLPMIETFASTRLALQARGNQSSGVIFVDEIGSNSFGDLDNYVYETGNGSCKSRLNSSGELQDMPPKTLFVMTTGEVPIASLLSRNARNGVLDRAVDINVGSPDVCFEEQEQDHFRLIPSNDMKVALIAGITKQYGSVAPEFIRALIHEMGTCNWEGELGEITQSLADELPSYVSEGGARRVLTRFALAVLAGRIALRNNVFDSAIIDEEKLLDGVRVCVHLWVTTRWNYLHVLADHLVKAGRIPQSSPKSLLSLYRHKDWDNEMPTVMITKESFEGLFPRSSAEVISKRLREDGIIFNADIQRNTVGKPARYHLRTDWLHGHGFDWFEEFETFKAA